MSLERNYRLYCGGLVGDRHVAQQRHRFGPMDLFMSLLKPSICGKASRLSANA